MKMIQILIDCEFMTQFENCGNFISFVEKAIKAKRNFKGIDFSYCLNRVIILSGRSNMKTAFNLAMMASDVMGIMYEYNQMRKEHGKSLFVADIYAVTNNNGFISKRKYLFRFGGVQWEG